MKASSSRIQLSTRADFQLMEPIERGIHQLSMAYLQDAELKGVKKFNGVRLKSTALWEVNSIDKDLLDVESCG